MLPNLRFLLFFVCLSIEIFENVLIYRLAMGNIVVYHITIISNTLNKVTHYMELRVVKGWSK